MKKQIISITTLTCLLFYCVVAFASDADFAVESTPQEFKQRSVREDIKTFLSEKNVNKGKNIRSNGSEIFISQGTGTIDAPRNSPAYMDDRIIAFENAMLDAKAKMAKYVGTEISKKVVRDFSSGQPPEAVIKKQTEGQPSEPGIVEKTEALLNAKLDKLLKEEGVDTSKPVPEEVIKKVVRSDQFSSFVNVAAESRLAGMQVWKTFEQSPDGKKGQIGVVTVYSDKLHKMANALFSGDFSTLPSGTPKKPIIEQIPQDGKVLLTTFGVQQKTDENGRLVLVAFGQGVPMDEDPTSLDMAYEEAETEAFGYLRQFAGEIVAVATAIQRYKTVEKFEDGMEEFKNKKYLKKHVESGADSLKITGIQTIYEWNGTHPLTGMPVAGVVVAWSPSSSRSAQKIGAKMKAPAKKTSSNSGGNRYQAGTSNQKGSYSGSGAEADEDSF